MASTYSDLKIELIGTGEQTGTWGTTTNDNFSIAIGEAITGSADVAFSSADVTLTLTNTNASQAARNLRLNLTGTSGGARNLILGSGCQIEKLYLINNGLADAVTVKNTSGTGIAVPAGKSMFVFNNGTNVVEATSGDIFGPASSTDNAVARFDGTTGKAIQNSVVTIADSTGNMAGVGTISSGAITSSSLTSGRVLYAGTSGLIQDDADFTFNGTTVTMANDASISGLTVGKGGGSVASNTAVGTNALGVNSTGAENTALGVNSLVANTTTGNTGLGFYAAAATTTGQYNVAVGRYALTTNTTGGNNTALGMQSLNSNTTASSNTAVGYQAFYTSTSKDNTGVGSRAGFATTTGENNVAIGANAFDANTTGGYSVAVGHNSLTTSTTGNFNVAVGYESALSNTTGSNNVAIGRQALAANTTASGNTAVGYEAGLSSTTGTVGTFIGYQAGRSFNNANTSFGDVYVGQQAGLSTTTGANNTFVGGAAGVLNTTGSYNIAIGGAALNTNSTASNNTAVGYQSLASNTTASNNTAVGYVALYSNSTGANNVAIGVNSLYSNTTASDNVAIGQYAGNAYTVNGSNTCIGANAGRLSTGTGNTFLGAISGYNMTTGSKNTILGRYDGNQGGLDIRTASNYIVLSDGDGNPRAYWNNTGQFIFGVDAGDIVGQIENINAVSPYGIRIKFINASPNNAGNYFQECRDGGNTLRYQLYSNGGIANFSANNSNLSDQREKKDIELAGNYLDKVCAIPVKTFLYNDQTDTDLNLGVIAQDVQAIAPELVMESNWGTKEEPKMRLSIYQTDLQYALMKAIQELKAEFDAYKATHP
jgi:hypothetical protein